MAPISLLLLWPLRKAAVIPAALLSSLALGAAFGSFDLARKGTRLLLPHSTSKRSGTDAVAAASAATVAGGMLTLRELLFAPRAVPLPALRVDGAAQRLGERLRNASVLFLHSAQHFPYRFRFVGAFVAGAVGGSTWETSVWAYNRDVAPRHPPVASSAAAVPAAVAAPESAAPVP